MYVDGNPPARRMQGMSLIELLISLVVALVVSLAAASSAMVFNASQKQAGGAAGAASVGALSLAALKEDIGQAGLGFFGETAYLCGALNLSVGASDHSVAAFSPLQASRVGDLDQVDVVYAGDIRGGANVVLKQSSDLGSAVPQTFLPAAVGDAVLLAPAAVGVPVVPCTVRSVTAVNGTVPPSFTFANTGAHNQVAFAAPTSYAAKDRVNLLGAITWNRFRVDGENLVIEQPLTGTSAILARGVVAMRVQYGVSAAAGQTTITSWQDPTGAGWSPLSVANVLRLRAVRIGVVLRSEQPEKQQAGVCVATPDVTNLRVLGFDPTPPDVGGIGWNCYRYRTTEVTIPLRNWVMGLS